MVPYCNTATAGNTYMQWAAVRTQQELRRIPPQSWVKGWVLFLKRACNETCQGWVPGLAFLPPKILDVILLGDSFPHTENSYSGAGVVITTSGDGSVGVKAIRVWRMLLQLGVLLVEKVDSGRVGTKIKWKRNSEKFVPVPPWQRLTLHSSQ